jgi:NAD(P)-dependent dehydrogenase (short-subunit alcohol dehydrogenase family)
MLIPWFSDASEPLVAERSNNREAFRGIVELTPLRRVGGPEDIVGVVVFLPSEASNFCCRADLLS